MILHKLSLTTHQPGLLLKSLVPITVLEVLELEDTLFIDG